MIASTASLLAIPALTAVVELRFALGKRLADQAWRTASVTGVA
jgi:hypothetical protein